MIYKYCRIGLQMNVVDVDGCRMYRLSDLETAAQRDTFWLIQEMQDATSSQLTVSETHIAEESLRRFLKWYNRSYPCHPIKEPHKPAARAYSTSHRIEIAYKTLWRCALCDKILTPNFEIDHIVEIRHGGADDWGNTCALCVSCHAEKTRANTLKMNKAFEAEFRKRVVKIEKNIFENLKRKRSPYF